MTQLQSWRSEQFRQRKLVLAYNCHNEIKCFPELICKICKAMSNNPQYLSVSATNQRYPFIHLSEESNYERRNTTRETIANTAQTQSLDLLFSKTTSVQQSSDITCFCLRLRVSESLSRTFSPYKLGVLKTFKAS